MVVCLDGKYLSLQKQEINDQKIETRELKVAVETYWYQVESKEDWIKRGKLGERKTTLTNESLKMALSNYKSIDWMNTILDLSYE